MRSLLRSALLVVLALTAARAADSTAPRLELRDGDRVVFLGDTLIEREQYHGWIELMLTARSADRNVTFRNLGWSADTPTGTSRTGLSLMQAGREPAEEGWTQLQQQITDARPTVIFVGYGMANSFDGPAGSEKFRADYNRLLDTLAKLAPTARLVLLSPAPHETLGGNDASSASSAHNANLARLSTTLGEIAAARHLPFFSLFDALTPSAAAATALTDNGIHLNAAGYRAAAFALEDFLFGAERAAGPAGTDLKCAPRSKSDRAAIGPKQVAPDRD